MTSQPNFLVFHHDGGMKGLQFTPSDTEHHHIILDSIADGVFTVNLNWRITSFNKAAEKITGIPREEAVGRLCSEVLSADLCKKGCVLRQTMRSGRSVRNMPVHILRGDGKRIPINVSCNVLKDAGGKAVGGVEIFRDLSIVNELRRELRGKHSFGDIISKNAKMTDILSILPMIAESDSTVMIHGASGTGKELFARAIHDSSPRKNGPFVPVNCGALPETLCESELFGYKAGAFTDARKNKPGRFAMAQNGTIFLDEIGDIPPPVQVRLLRVLEARVYEPLGSTNGVSTNARVITATHRDIESLVREEKFREDLYYRINVMRLSLPPLVDRREDIPLLIDHFIDRFNRLKSREIIGLTPEAMAVLMLHSWPGNVRELENTIEHAFVLCQEDLIRLRHLPKHLLTEDRAIIMPTGLTLQEVEKHAIQVALARNRWRKVATARELGVDKNTLRRKMLRLGIPSQQGTKSIGKTPEQES
jgi:sigma-54 dependent transcriptional regulator, acetoin dehydrogenase operon transcriptional activator AcoR